MTPQRRRKYLVNPRLQIGSALVLLATAGLYVLLQAILLQFGVASIADPTLQGQVIDELLPILRWNLLATTVVLVPMTLVVGVYMTHRVVGPLYRFEQFLRALARGEDPGECRLRDSDELGELCELLNEATRPLRASGGSPPAAGTDGRSSRPAA